MERKQVLRSQKGFTLIEIISVLVLIGILAAVAVPKFINLQDDAKLKAAEAAVAEGIAQVNMYSAKYILANSTVPAATTDLTGMTNGLVNPYTAGEFSIAFGTVAGGAIPITVTGVTGTKFDGVTATGSAPLPQ